MFQFQISSRALHDPTILVQYQTRDSQHDIRTKLRFNRFALASTRKRGFGALYIVTTTYGGVRTQYA
jgi:hypothetical protein